MIYFGKTDANKYMIFGENEEWIYDFNTNHIRPKDYSIKPKSIFKNCIIRYNRSIEKEITTPCLIEYPISGFPYYTCLLISKTPENTGKGIMLTHQSKSIVGKLSHIIPVDKCEMIKEVKVEGMY